MRRQRIQEIVSYITWKKKGREKGKRTGYLACECDTDAWTNKKELHCSLSDLGNESLALFLILHCRLQGSPAVQSSRWPLKFAVRAFIVRVLFHSKGQFGIMDILQVFIIGMGKLVDNAL